MPHSEYNCVTYSWSSAASPHTANDGTRQRQNGSKGAHDQNAQENALDRLDVIAVVHCERIK